MSKLPYLLLAASFLAAPLAGAESVSPSADTITVDAHAATTPFPHFWEQTFGSGRAILALRHELPRTTSARSGRPPAFKAVRFHGIFNDDVGLYDPNAHHPEPRPSPSTKLKQASPPTTSATSTRSTMGSSMLGVKSLRRAQLHAEARWPPTPTRPSVLLVQARRLAPERLRPLGTR